MHASLPILALFILVQPENPPEPSTSLPPAQQEPSAPAATVEPDTSKQGDDPQNTLTPKPDALVRDATASDPPAPSTWEIVKVVALGSGATCLGLVGSYLLTIPVTCVMSNLPPLSYVWGLAVPWVVGAGGGLTGWSVTKLLAGKRVPLVQMLLSSMGPVLGGWALSAIISLISIPFIVLPTMVGYAAMMMGMGSTRYLPYALGIAGMGFLGAYACGILAGLGGCTAMLGGFGVGSGLVGFMAHRLGRMRTAEESPWAFDLLTVPDPGTEDGEDTDDEWEED